MIRKLKYIIPVILLITSCKKQLDINTDPNNPVSLPAGTILPTAEIFLAQSLAISSGISQVLEVYTHQMVVREDPDQYGATGSDFNIQQHWNTLYTTVFTNLDVIIGQGDPRTAGIAQILKAYGYSTLVDVYGDVPFSEVNTLVSKKNFNPKFDKGADIYPQLLAMLDAGIANLAKATSTAAITGDLIYKGDVKKWTKAANSIKLKLLLTQNKVKPNAAAISALVTGGNLISTTAEDFILPYGPNAATDDRNPAFNDYFASQRGNYISPWFYEILKGYNTTIFTGITDPRIPYYFFNQLKGAAAATTPTEYRDGDFVSIYFGSLGPNAAQNQQNNMTVLGIYPAGGKFDDGSGGVVTGTSGTGAAPYRFVTYADVLYMEAELMQTGVVTGDARATLQKALTESFKQVDYFTTTYVKPTQTVPALAGTAPATSYINKILAYYDANTSQQLQTIITEKWIQSFGSAVDAYNDYRRTGYPVIFNPRDPTQAPGGKVQPPVDGDPTKPNQAAVSVQLIKNFPLTLPWFTGELQTNANAPAQKADPSTYKPFWLP